MFGFRRRRTREEVMTDTESADPPESPLWTDDAIELDEEDTLDRKRFADMVAARIDACVPGQKSTVFGLVGPWGSGKTSLIKLVRKRLGVDWKISIFSPWASDTAAGLQVEFLAAVASLLEGDDEKSVKAKAELRKYASVCANLLKVIPYAGTGLGGAAEKALEITNPPWHKQFEEVSNMLRSLGSRVLLIADDIDRLDADELLSLLKIVRLLGRFPNVHYLIAYDQATVESLLDFKGLAARSSAFMEKIVQYPFEVPPIAGAIQRRLLVDTIFKFIEVHDIRLERTQGERFSDFIGVIAPALLTPRAHNRFGEQLLAFGGMLKFGEIDVVDFVALSFLRIFHHRVYDRIPAWKRSLQSGKDLVGRLDGPEIDDAEWLSRIRQAVDHDDDAILVKHVLAGLFAGIKSELLYLKDHDLALSDDTYFQRYFILSVAEDDVEDQLIQSAVRNIVYGDSAHNDVQRYRDILDGTDNQLAALAYEKSQKFRSTDPIASPVLVGFLFDQLKSRPEDKTPLFDSARNVLWRWLEAEVFKALSESKLAANDILDDLPPQDVLRLVIRILRNRTRPEESSIKALEGFSVHYRGLLMNDLEGLLDSDLDFNWVASVIAILSRGNNFHEFGDSVLSSANLQLMDRVVRAMVTINRWGGNDDELVFNSETLTRLFRPEAIIQLAGHLPVAPQVSSINKHELSRENQGYLAHASVKSIAEMLSS